MSKIVSSIVDHLEHKPIYVENERGEVLLSFADVYHLQNFVAEVRKHGVVYGLELAKMTKEAPPVAPVSVVRYMSRG